MSKIYPEMKKDNRTKVKCITCEALEDPTKKDPVFFCINKRKIIQEDQLYEERVCREHEP